ncbi:Imm6 family immunity protein [Pasteurella skyensis]|uniref:Imm6 family immunity protein n=1 Tax=Phocoenobacter skyensis TaxID=97481 RepID=A0AAJ6N8N2_9PAST|nr:Imm6 family immunity protein [Pasteurella skyensis]MDP8162050.1 Imm6 family immunity protein [Pasteurella skyensis]MDP8172206.1 Imm6 family immunity protein [Pasteurella skyensis]MDP8176445.1 Imm6 family immunity protein [Pasteurella skyensis]MDP8178334.1 Imm6 family immunity protein [Pasteurella skyensis]MDP8182910.1 Imm6 family immunity protein [Pasteurella skyensis]
MQKSDFLTLTDIEKCKAVLRVCEQVIPLLKNNQKIYTAVNSATTKAKQFVLQQDIQASAISVFLDNIDEDNDLGMLVYQVKNDKEEQALDIIIYIVGFIANIAHKMENTASLMPAPVIEATDEVVFEIFVLYEKLQVR